MIPMRTGQTRPLVLLVAVAALTACGNTNQTRTADPTPGEPVVENITPEQAAALIRDNQDSAGFVILDVRTPEEFATGHLQTAVNINFYDSTFREAIGRLDRAPAYLVYCKSGGRSGSSLTVMADLGFARVYNMLGGITRWQTEGRPVVSSSG